MSTLREQAVQHAVDIFHADKGPTAIYEALVAAEQGRLEALAVVKDVEWSGHADGDPACPVCREYDGFARHRDGCALAAVLGAAVTR